MELQYYCRICSYAGKEDSEGCAEGASKDKDQEAHQAAANQAHVRKQEEVRLMMMPSHLVSAKLLLVHIAGWWHLSGTWTALKVLAGEGSAGLNPDDDKKAFFRGGVS